MGAISISTLQWLTHCDTTKTKPKQRLANLFNSLYKCLKRGSRAIFQLYPTASSQLELISECAMKAGFVFSMIIDFPNSSKAKKYYIILDSGSVKRIIPKAMTMNDINEKQKQLLYQNPMDEDNPNYRNNEETIKMRQGIDPIEQQHQKSYFVHGDKKNGNNKSYLRNPSKKRGIDRFLFFSKDSLNTICCFHFFCLHAQNMTFGVVVLWDRFLAAFLLFLHCFYNLGYLHPSDFGIIIVSVSH